jgi:hypothetical protein
VYSLVVKAPADRLEPVGDRRGRSHRRDPFRSQRKFLDTHIRHRPARRLAESLAPGAHVIAVIEASFHTALVASIRCPPGKRQASLTAIRTVALPAIVSTTNEEDAAAKRANQLIQSNFVFHPPRGGKKLDAQSRGLYRPRSSSFIRLTEDPER